MKKALLLLLTVFMCLLASRGMAYSGDESVQEFLPCITGTWVDEQGHRQVHIFGGTAGINTFSIVAIKNWQGNMREGSAMITVMEKRATRDMFVEYHRGENDYLILDKKLKLVPEKSEKIHAETVGGIMLDMPMMGLLKLYGPPQEYLDEAATKNLCGVEGYSWYYKNEGWLATFDPCTNTVDRIFLFAGSQKFLDTVVLNADSDVSRFAGLYGFSKTPAKGDVFHLGEQEYLSFAGYPNYICLSIYP